MHIPQYYSCYSPKSNQNQWQKKSNELKIGEYLIRRTRQVMHKLKSCAAILCSCQLVRVNSDEAFLHFTCTCAWSACSHIKASMFEKKMNFCIYMAEFWTCTLFSEIEFIQGIVSAISKTTCIGIVKCPYFTRNLILQILRGPRIWKIGYLQIWKLTFSK